MVRWFALLLPARSLRPGFAFLLFTVCGACSLYAQPEFRVDSSLVVLHVTVADHRGRLIDNLPQEAFQVYEEGSPQTITLFRHEDAPVAVGLVVDNSGSMLRKLSSVVAAGNSFVRSSNPDDQMFVVNFNEHVSLGLPPGEAFATGAEKLATALSQIRADGETALYDALDVALEHIRRSSLEKKVLIVVSDGGDNASRRQFREMLPALQRSDVIVYTIGLFDEYDRDSNPGVLRQLAKVSGGASFFPREIPDVTGVLQSISRQIRSQYTLGYVPANASPDRSFRRIQVKLIGPHADRWIATTRTGYFAPPLDK